MSSRDLWTIGRNLPSDLREKLLKRCSGMGLAWPKDSRLFVHSQLEEWIKPVRATLTLLDDYRDAVNGLNRYNGSRREVLVVYTSDIEMIQEVFFRLKDLSRFYLNQPIRFFEAGLALSNWDDPNAP